MKRILFVDDEQRILDGLANLLRRQRNRWEMVFALGGEAALAQLRKAPFDVVVSDMRMPGMDGPTLLQRIKEEYPIVARIILSGHSEREAVMRALPVAHQFLNKPCDADILLEIIERTCNLQRLLSDDAIRRVVGKINKLPSVPSTYWELTRTIAKPNVEISEIAKVVEKDPAICIKVLQLVNSAYFGLAHRITSVQQAITYLGLELLKGLVLTAQVFATMELKPVEGFSLERIQRYSLQTAMLAKRLVRNPKYAEDAFTTGLVHDIGKVILALALPDHLAEVGRDIQKSHRLLQVVEQEKMGVTHAEIGAYLLGIWGLPVTIVEAVAYHHHPSLVAQGDCEVLAAVHIADAIIDTACMGEPPPLESKLDFPFLARLGIKNNLAEWRADAERAIQKMEEKSNGRS